MIATVAKTNPNRRMAARYGLSRMGKITVELRLDEKRLDGHQRQARPPR
jgi:hypothetical protein